MSVVPRPADFTTKSNSESGDDSTDFTDLFGVEDPFWLFPGVDDDRGNDFNALSDEYRTYKNINPLLYLTERDWVPN